MKPSNVFEHAEDKLSSENSDSGIETSNPEALGEAGSSSKRKPRPCTMFVDVDGMFQNHLTRNLMLLLQDSLVFQTVLDAENNFSERKTTMPASMPVVTPAPQLVKEDSPPKSPIIMLRHTPETTEEPQTSPSQTYFPSFCKANLCVGGSITRVTRMEFHQLNRLLNPEYVTCALYHLAHCIRPSTVYSVCALP